MVTMNRLHSSIITKSRFEQLTTVGIVEFGTHHFLQKFMS
jgi:hypothetical protein